MAWVRLKPGATATQEELREFCRGKMAYYKIPRYIKFVTEFPMTVTGKIQKFRMREMVIAEQEQLGKAGTTKERTESNNAVQREPGTIPAGQ
jgi:acyl-CoA synthetase (AMP-forming)/AMP-acid ligase II